MHRHMFPVFMILLALASALPLVVWAEDTAEMEAWAAAMTPGDVHAELADQAGGWNYLVTIWKAPKAEPMKLEGVSVKTMIMGGRFLREELSGEFMGQPFHGFGLNGYDNVAKEHVGIWFDNMGTGIHYYTGHENKKGEQVFTSKMHDPATGKAFMTRSVGRTIDRDHHTYESYMPAPDGSEFLHMRVEYTRASN